jgi:hypothetical protein
VAAGRRGDLQIHPEIQRGAGRQQPHRQLPGTLGSAINYGGNLPYDVLSPIGTNGAYYYASATYGF